MPPIDRSHNTYRNVIRLALIFLTAYISFILLVYILEHLMVPKEVEALHDFQLAELDEIPDQSLSDSYFHPIPNQWFSYKVGHAGTYAVLRNEVPEEYLQQGELSILINRARDKVSVHINGNPIGFERAETSVDTTAMGPRLYTIPNSFIHEGRNVVDIYLYGHHWPPRLFKAYVGPTKKLRPAYTWRKFLTVEGLNILSGVGLFMALFTISVGLVSKEQRAEYITMGIITIFWVARNVYYSIEIYDWPLAYQSLFFNFTTFGLVMAVAAFAIAWGRGHPRYYAIYAAVAIGYTLLAFLFDMINLQWGDNLYLYVGLPTIIGVIIWSGYQQFKMFGNRDFSIPAMIGAAVCTSAISVDILSEIMLSSGDQKWPLMTSLPYTPLAIIFVAMGLVYSLVYRTVALQQAERRQSEELAKELAIKSRELEQSYAKTREQEKYTAIAAERQRIMQDMHDGIGSQLLGLQMQIQHGDMSTQQVSSELKNSLNDLRLIVDSLDTETDDISLALGAFRARIQPQLSAANVNLEWKMDISGKISGFGPEAVLHIYRIMQEAVTNALRHSQMTKLSISMRRDKGPDISHGADDYLTIRIMDNGGGFDEASIFAGRGLKNMRRRAELLNGTIDIQKISDGLSVFLKVPTPRPL